MLNRLCLPFIAFYWMPISVQVPFLNANQSVEEWVSSERLRKYMLRIKKKSAFDTKSYWVII